MRVFPFGFIVCFTLGACIDEPVFVLDEQGPAPARGDGGAATTIALDGDSGAPPAPESTDAGSSTVNEDPSKNEDAPPKKEDEPPKKNDDEDDD